MLSRVPISPAMRVPRERLAWRPTHLSVRSAIPSSRRNRRREAVARNICRFTADAPTRVSRGASLNYWQNFRRAALVGAYDGVTASARDEFPPGPALAQPRRRMARNETPAASWFFTPRKVKKSAIAWKRVLTLVLVVAVVLAALLAYRRISASRAPPVGLIQVNGRIEGDAVLLATKQPGRIATLLVHEGDSVKANQTVARLEDTATRARLAQAEAARDVARARADAARAALAVMRREVPIDLAASRATLATSDATLAEAQDSEAQTEREKARSERLFSSGVLDEETMERVRLGRANAGARVTAADAARRKAAQSVANAELGAERIRAKVADIAALDAAARQADAAVKEAEEALADLTITTPVRGTVTTRFAESGEVIAAGSALFEVVDLDRLYLKVFVPEADIGKIRLGLHANIYTDAFPDKRFPAEVRYIASRAEFTPKEVQTRDERVKLVYAVKLYVVDNRERRLSPGLSADAMIRWQEDAPWSPPR